MIISSRYAVIGNPIHHSLSPEVHAEFARQTGIELEYDRLFAPLTEFPQVVQEFFNSGGRGLNVTAPFKGEAAAWVDQLDAQADLTESVNTIALQSDENLRSQTKGYSTDGPGLIADLNHQWELSLEGLQILLLGAGGAARGVIPTLLEHKPKTLVVANRTLSRAEALIARYRNLATCELRAQSFGTSEGDFDLVVNATSGLFDAANPPEVHGFADALCYDLSYNREQETGFCRTARQQGARDVRDGLGMLVWQAAYSFEIWHGLLPEVAPVLASIAFR